MEDSGLIKQFGKRIQHLRRIRKLTQDQLSELTELSVDTISNIERGLSSTRIETIASLAKALSVTLPELFEFEGTAYVHHSHWKAVERLVEVISHCPPDRLPALTKMVEQAIQLAKGA